jgi:hypothetical protein
VTVGPSVSRRALLSGAAAGLLTSACTPADSGNPSGGRSGPRPTGKDATIFELSFTERYRYRPFHLVAPGFVEDRRSALGDVATLTLSDRSPAAPFAAVELEVSDGSGIVVAGLGSDDGDRVVATYNPSGRTAAIEVRAEGTTRVVRRATVDLPGSFTLGFAVCENQVTVLARPDGASDWKPLLTERTKVADLVDLRVPERLERFRYTWGVRTGTAVLGDVRAGLFGMTGLRDPHLVQHADGRPYVRDGKVYLTWTCAGLGFFQQAHWGVFTLDLADLTRLEQVSQLFSHRDGLLVGDHAGQLVRDGDQWLVATSSWGDFDFQGVHVRHLTTTDDLLTGVHLLETRATDLPTDVSSWDPGFTRADASTGLEGGDGWLLGFVESPSQDPFDFHPALARTDAESPWEGLTKVGAADDLHQCEGPILARVEDRLWFLASDGDARHYPVFDLRMRRVGRLDAPYPTNIPHPQLLQLDEDRWIMISFDGTQYAEDTMGYGGHGDVVIMETREE